MSQLGKRIDRKRQTALYRFYDSAGILLYVGIAFTPDRRWHQHASTKGWWPEVDRKESTWYTNRVEALAAERAVIASERPRYNIVGAEAPVASPPRAPRQKRPTAKRRAPVGPVAALRAYRRAEDKAQRANEELEAEIRRAIASGEWQIGDVAEVTGYSREHIRRICKEAGVEPLR